MRYRKIESADISEIGLECPSATRLEDSAYTALVEKALGRGINLFRAVEPAEATILGETLDSLNARRTAVVAAGIPEFFAAFARHGMALEEFLEHELADRLARLKSNYLDMLVIDLGAGRAMDLKAVVKEAIPAGEAGAVSEKVYEGGVFLHETIADCLEIIDGFKKQGRVRLAAVGGENVAALMRVLVKNRDFDAVFAPYNYGFRAAANELVPIAAETKTAVIATRPLWWSIRGLPVTVVAENPYPAERAPADVDADILTKAACKWPLAESAVTSVLAEAESPEAIETLAAAATDGHWNKADEEMLQTIAENISAQQGVFLVLSAMNSPDPDIRARGWAAYVKKGLPESGYDPFADEDQRQAALERIAAEVVLEEPTLDEDDLEELL